MRDAVQDARARLADVARFRVTATGTASVLSNLSLSSTTTIALLHISIPLANLRLLRPWNGW